MAVLTKMEEPFERLLDDLPAPAPSVIVADAFLPWAAEVGNRRNIPVASVWTMSASVYTLFYHVDLLVQNGHFPVDLSAKEDGIVDYIPGLPPIHVSDLPTVLSWDQEKVTLFLSILPQQSNSKYLIFTSIHDLESQVLNALKQASPFTIFNIGPFSAYSKLKSISHSSNNNDGLIDWLNRHPPCSVLYVSLGSFLSVSTPQLEEIAHGLRDSGVNFLWVAHREAKKLQTICGEKGLIVTWCDQLKVLSHPSVGGFWSHCGWNSTKEAVLAGMPMLTSPILMDQVPNAKAIVEDWKVGWRVAKGIFGEEAFVKRDVISELVREFMDLKNSRRKELTDNATRLKSICELEFGEGQCFEASLDGFVESIMYNTE